MASGESPIRVLAVAHQSTQQVLVVRAQATPTATDLCEGLLENALHNAWESGRQFVSREHQLHCFHTYTMNGYSFVLVSPRSMANSTALRYLRDQVAAHWCKLHPGAGTVSADQAERSFGRLLQSRIAAPYVEDKIDKIHTAIEETKAVVEKNIDAIEMRGESLALLSDHSSQLASRSKVFRRGANQMKWSMRCRVWPIVAVIVALAVAGAAFGISVAVCGGISYDKCRGSSGENNATQLHTMFESFGS